MTSGRNRATRSLTGIINKIDTKVDDAASAKKALLPGSVGPAALGTNSVGNDAVQPQAIGTENLQNGAVNTPNLGTINQITSDSSLVLISSTGVTLSGAAYADRPYSGDDIYYEENAVRNTSLGYGTPAPERTYPTSMTYDGTLRADPSSASVRYATVSAYYPGSGLVPIIFYGANVNASTSPIDTYASILSNVKITPGDTVICVHDQNGNVADGYNTGGDTTSSYNNPSMTRGWVIVGRTSASEVLAAGFTPKAPNFFAIPAGSITMTTLSGYQPAGVTRTAGGITVLRGLVTYPINTTVPAGTVIYRLPPGFEPDWRVDFPAACAPAVNASNAIGLSVYPDGTVRNMNALPSSSSAQWISLENIRYPAAGFASWMTLDLAPQRTGLYYSIEAFADNGFIDGEDDSSGPVRVWVDPDNTVWWGGQMQITDDSPVADNTSMITYFDPAAEGTPKDSNGNFLPPGPLNKSVIGSYLQHHYPTITSTGQFGLVASSSYSLQYKSGTPSDVGTNISLASVYWTSAIFSGPVTQLYTNFTYANGWSSRGSAYPPASYYVRPDGLVICKGLMTVGTYNAAATSATPSNARVNTRALHLAVTGGVAGRVDTMATGVLQPANGSTSWFSLDGISYVTETRGS